MICTENAIGRLGISVFFFVFVFLFFFMQYQFSCGTRFMGMVIKLNEAVMFV